jgi:hypothetical protein
MWRGVGSRDILDPMQPMVGIRKIVPGGQTGVDRAALDFAIKHNVPHGGWCPRGRLAEDGTLSSRDQMTETDATDPAERTERNVRR